VVTLQWSNVTGELGYRIYRDGALIAMLPANSTTYDDASPDYNSHAYQIQSFNDAGSANSSVQNSEGLLRMDDSNAFANAARSARVTDIASVFFFCHGRRPKKAGRTLESTWDRCSPARNWSISGLCRRIPGLTLPRGGNLPRWMDAPRSRNVVFEQTASPVQTEILTTAGQFSTEPWRYTSQGLHSIGGVYLQMKDMFVHERISQQGATTQASRRLRGALFRGAGAGVCHRNRPNLTVQAAARRQFFSMKVQNPRTKLRCGETVTYPVRVEFVRPDAPTPMPGSFGSPKGLSVINVSVEASSTNKTVGDFVNATSNTTLVFDDY
jgi:hypothetical protein